MENKTLVAYFSASGVTAKAAFSLAAACGGDLYEIKPAVPYTSKDLNWQDQRSRSSVEMKDPSARPELADGNLDLTAYDRIFLGFPIWWYTAPRIIQTFFGEPRFHRKNHDPLCHIRRQRSGEDSEGSGSFLSRRCDSGGTNPAPRRFARETETVGSSVLTIRRGANTSEKCEKTQRGTTY